MPSSRSFIGITRAGSYVIFNMDMNHGWAGQYGVISVR
jgi:hypothetical protein